MYNVTINAFAAKIMMQKATSFLTYVAF